MSEKGCVWKEGKEMYQYNVIQWLFFFYFIVFLDGVLNLYMYHSKTKDGLIADLCVAPFCHYMVPVQL